ncbi:MAG TPA: protein-tyrosine-phosphatase [Propylenella sp.]
MSESAESAESSEAPGRRRLTICGLTELGAFRNADVTHILSILDPSYPDPADFASYRPHKRLTLRFDDIIEAGPGMQLPERRHIEALLAFGDGLAVPEGDPLGHLLVHCHAGISRSTASMTILLAEALPEAGADALYARIREIRPQAWPNSRMIGLADDLLGRGGMLVDGLRRHYGEQIRRRPDLADMIQRVGRGKEVLMAA